MKAASPPAIVVAGLTKRYGLVRALSEIDFAIGPGQIVALVGANGAGKTTLLEILAGLRSPTEGKALVLDHPATRLPSQARARIGWVAHANGLYAGLSARENLRFFGRLWGIRDPGLPASALLAEFGLAGREDEPVGRFSRGMARRVALSRALLPEPSILFLDEPFDGLDSSGVVTLQRHLDRARARGASVLLSSHNLEAAFAVADREIVLERGRVAIDRPVGAAGGVHGQG